MRRGADEAAEGLVALAATAADHGAGGGRGQQALGAAPDAGHAAGEGHLDDDLDGLRKVGRSYCIEDDMICNVSDDLTKILYDHNSDHHILLYTIPILSYPMLCYTMLISKASGFQKRPSPETTSVPPDTGTFSSTKVLKTLWT